MDKINFFLLYSDFSPDIIKSLFIFAFTLPVALIISPLFNISISFDSKFISSDHDKFANKIITLQKS